jgi:8-oxo-dGTP diphosphatase
LNARAVQIVALALVHRHGTWLVALRFSHAHLGGLWEFPGGKLLAGETPQDAAIRELREECGVDAVARRVLAAHTVEYADRTVVLTPVVCDYVGGEARSLGNAAVRWVRATELNALPMPAANAALIRTVLAITQSGRED